MRDHAIVCDNRDLAGPRGAGRPGGGRDTGPGRRPIAVEGAQMGAAGPRPASPERDDAELMRQLAAGRQEALGPLHARYAPLIFNLAAQTLDRPAAEELVQEVFVAVWRNAATFDPARGAFRSWVLQIAHLRILNELRRRGRRPQAAPDPDGLRLASLPDQEPEPDELAWREYRRAAVQSAVAALPPAQRQALSLAYFEELTHEQVASFLNLPLGTAKTRIRAGLQKLRLQLAPLVLVALAALAGTLGVRVQQQRAQQARDEAALRLTTQSDLAPRRLTAAPGVPAATHANYRSRPGNDLVVINLEHFAPAPAGKVYQAWVRRGGTWFSLGTAHLDADGYALLIAQGDELASPPDALEVTLEPAGGSKTPTGPVIVSWTSAER
ncbi:MAG TPA: sigma-70 family RNA polymerase sigma factor [Thermomicrobiales bacterium]|nr:sigma-70 family RNA polymerase sigma factor [Thermomicrobiales bacterium]